MSAIVAAQVDGVESADAVLSGVTTAIAVNAALCVAAAILVALFLRTTPPADGGTSAQG